MSSQNVPSTLDDLFGHDVKEVNDIMIIDFSGILHSTYHVQVRFDNTLNDEFQKFAMWRYLILNSVLTVKEKFKPQEIVLALDSSSWRKKAFKYYKAQRVLDREKQSDFNFEEFLEVSNSFIEEITETMPYKVIKVDGAEGDDIIGILAHHLKNKRVTIVSRDKDFKQLLKNQNIKMFDPIDKVIKQVECPYNFLIEQIVRGDKADGIPNILSEDNIFVTTGKRQKSITKGIMESVYDLGLEEFAIRNNVIDKFERNKKLIELTKEHIPEDIWDNVIYQYNNQAPVGNYIKIVQFLRKHKIRSLVEKANQFLY
jgi:UDP-N-acetylglucosamine transferase subunit ALG13